MSVLAVRKFKKTVIVVCKTVVLIDEGTAVFSGTYGSGAVLVRGSVECNFIAAIDNK